MENIKKLLGWKRGLPVKHALRFVPQRGMAASPPLVDLTSGCPVIWDQSWLGSCTAQSGAALGQFVMKKLGLGNYTPARLAIYYWTRKIMGTVMEDSGASLSDTMKAMSTFGLPREAFWKYAPGYYRVAPGPRTVEDGKKHVLGQPLLVNNSLNDLKSCLAEGWPFIFGYAVYSSFNTKEMEKSGVMPMPKPNEEVLGGHAVMAVGYDDSKQMFKIRNSWGTRWGQKGYFWMPYAFITDRDYADDFWTAHNFATFKK